MKDETFIDYAGPLMAVERLAKEAHNACLERSYAAAQEAMLQLIVEARLTLQAIRHIEEKEKDNGQTISRATEAVR